MGFWSRTFTWWNGATWGTGLWTRLPRREGRPRRCRQRLLSRQEEPRVALGDLQRLQRRQPRAAGLAGVAQGHDRRASRTRRFRRSASSRQPPSVNLTGTMAAFRPDGSLGRARSGRHRPAITSPGRPTEREAARRDSRCGSLIARSPAAAARSRAPSKRTARGPQRANIGPGQASRASPRWRSASRFSAFSTSATGSSATPAEAGPVGPLEQCHRPPARLRDDRAVGK